MWCFYYLNQKPQPFDFSAVLDACSHNINGGSFNAAVAPNVGKFCDIFFDSVEFSGKQLTQIVGKHLGRIYASRRTQLFSEARIVITHGGPSSFIMPIQINKVPAVVPRMQRFGEHMNDHQVISCREVSIRNGKFIMVEDISVLRDVLLGTTPLLQSDLSEHSAIMMPSIRASNKS